MFDLSIFKLLTISVDLYNFFTLGLYIKYFYDIIVEFWDFLVLKIISHINILTNHFVNYKNLRQMYIYQLRFLKDNKNYYLWFKYVNGFVTQQIS